MGNTSLLNKNIALVTCTSCHYTDRHLTLSECVGDLADAHIDTKERLNFTPFSLEASQPLRRRFEAWTTFGAHIMHMKSLFFLEKGQKCPFLRG